MFNHTEIGHRSEGEFLTIYYDRLDIRIGPNKSHRLQVEIRLIRVRHNHDTVLYLMDSRVQEILLPGETRHIGSERQLLPPQTTPGDGGHTDVSVIQYTQRRMEDLMDILPELQEIDDEMGITTEDFQEIRDSFHRYLSKYPRPRTR